MICVFLFSSFVPVFLLSLNEKTHLAFCSNPALDGQKRTDNTHSCQTQATTATKASEKLGPTGLGGGGRGRGGRNGRAPGLTNG